MPATGDGEDQSTLLTHPLFPELVLGDQQYGSSRTWSPWTSQFWVTLDYKEGIW